MGRRKKRQWRKIDWRVILADSDRVREDDGRMCTATSRGADFGCVISLAPHGNSIAEKTLSVGVTAAAGGNNLRFGVHPSQNPRAVSHMR